MKEILFLYIKTTYIFLFTYLHLTINTTGRTARTFCQCADSIIILTQGLTQNSEYLRFYYCHFKILLCAGQAKMIENVISNRILLSLIGRKSTIATVVASLCCFFTIRQGHKKNNFPVPSPSTEDSCTSSFESAPLLPTLGESSYCC